MVPPPKIMSRKVEKAQTSKNTDTNATIERQTCVSPSHNIANPYLIRFDQPGFTPYAHRGADRRPHTPGHAAARASPVARGGGASTMHATMSVR